MLLGACSMSMKGYRGGLLVVIGETLQFDVDKIVYSANRSRHHLRFRHLKESLKI